MDINRFVYCLLFTSLGLFTLVAQEKPIRSSERFESSIKAFEDRDKETAPATDPLLFVGSSSIRMWDIEKSWPGFDGINNGFGGSTLADSIHFFDRHIAPYKARAILIYAGDNDVSNGLTEDEILKDFIKLTDLIEGSAPGTPVVFIAIKPSIARWNLWPTMKSANDKIADYCEKTENLYFADIAPPMLETTDGKPDPILFKSDGLHMTAEGYKRWKSVILPILKKIGIRLEK